MFASDASLADFGSYLEFAPTLSVQWSSTLSSASYQSLRSSCSMLLPTSTQVPRPAASVQRSTSPCTASDQWPSHLRVGFGLLRDLVSNGRAPTLHFWSADRVRDVRRLRCPAHVSHSPPSLLRAVLAGHPGRRTRTEQAGHQMSPYLAGFSGTFPRSTGEHTRHCKHEQQLTFPCLCASMCCLESVQ